MYIVCFYICIFIRNSSIQTVITNHMLKKNVKNPFKLFIVSITLEVNVVGQFQIPIPNF